MMASPRITMCPVLSICGKMPSMALARCVILVPMCPLPRVTTFDNLPLSYVATKVRPSNFHESQMGLPSAHLASSAVLFVLASERAGYSCSSFSPAMLSALTLAVGESGRIVPVSSSKRFSWSKAASHSWSDIISARPL